MDRAIQEAIAIVSIDEAAAAECVYSLPRAGKAISGPSIGLAETLASTWGNLVLSVDDVAIGDEEVTVRGWIIDTQSGLGSQDFTRRRILKKNGERFNSDMINTTIAAARSILYRNLVLRVIPRPIVRRVYDEARNVVNGDAKTFKSRQKKAIEFWMKKGASQASVLGHFGYARIDQLTVGDMDYLLGLNNAVNDGAITLDQLFKEPKEEPETLNDVADDVIAKNAKGKKAKKPKPEAEREPTETVDAETGEVMEQRGSESPPIDPDTGEITKPESPDPEPELDVSKMGSQTGPTDENGHVILGDGQAEFTESPPNKAALRTTLESLMKDHGISTVQMIKSTLKPIGSLDEAELQDAIRRVESGKIKGAK